MHDAAATATAANANAASTNARRCRAVRNRGEFRHLQQHKPPIKKQGEQKEEDKEDAGDDIIRCNNMNNIDISLNSSRRQQQQHKSDNGEKKTYSFWQVDTVKMGSPTVPILRPFHAVGLNRKKMMKRKMIKTIISFNHNIMVESSKGPSI